MKRQLVQIPAEQVQKIKEIQSLRKDLAGFPLSKMVHILLQEKIASFFGETPTTQETAWFEYIREVIPLQIFSPIALGVVRHSQEMLGYPFTRIQVFNDSQRTWWCNYKQDIYKVGKFLLTSLQDQAFAEHHYQQHLQWRVKTNKQCAKIRSKKLATLSNASLFTIYSDFHEQLKRHHALSFDIDAIDIFLEKKIKEKISSNKKIKDLTPKELTMMYSFLTTPLTESYVAREESEIYALATKIYQDHKLKKIFQNDAANILALVQKSPKILADFQNLVQKYWWTNLGWSSGEEKTLRTFVEEVKKILQDFASAEAQQRQQNNRQQETIKRKKILLQQWKQDKEMAFLLEVFEHYTLFHDFRKEMQMKSTVVLQKLLIEIARRYNTKYDDLLWCWPSEIKELLLSGQLDVVPIRKRKDALYVLVTEDTIEQHTGEQALRKKLQNISAESNGQVDFQGVVASPGKVTGIAKVCYSPAEALEKLQEKEILVTSMTTPEYITSMKKAAAIVTNEGGITCHAAIVSRELGLPCIVGTEIATKTINDGDLIEVNGNHAIVKILRRATSSNNL